MDVKADKYEALNNWGTALARLAEGARSGAQRSDLFREACGKFRAALDIAPDLLQGLTNLGRALANVARTESVEDRELTLREAYTCLHRAVEVASAANRTDSAAFRFLIRVLLLQCATALQADNVGHARTLFLEALDRVEEAGDCHLVCEFHEFFRLVTRESRRAVCGEFLEEMRRRGMERELGILDPFAHALEYWGRGKDAEVLDRLNPEVREVVEEIVRRRPAP